MPKQLNPPTTFAIYAELAYRYLRPKRYAFMKLMGAWERCHAWLKYNELSHLDYSSELEAMRIINQAQKRVLNA